MLKFALISSLLFSPLNAMDFEFIEELFPLKEVKIDDFLIFEHANGTLYIFTKDNCYIIQSANPRCSDVSVSGAGR